MYFTQFERGLVRPHRLRNFTSRIRKKSSHAQRMALEGGVHSVYLISWARKPLIHLPMPQVQESTQEKV